jgi:hypothetical protein
MRISNIMPFAIEKIDNENEKIIRILIIKFLMVIMLKIIIV